MSTRKYLVSAGVAAYLALSLALSYPFYAGAVARSGAADMAQTSYSEIKGLVDKGEVSALSLYAENWVVATNQGGEKFRALIPAEASADLADDASRSGAAVDVKTDELEAVQPLWGKGLLALLGNIVLLALTLGAYWWFAIEKRGIPFRNNRVTRTEVGQSDTRFADVAGCEQEKLELMEVVEFLKDPSRFTVLGAQVPTGVLMSGPPGTGKTLLARAVAGEAGVPFFSISGSDFVEMFVGVGAGRVRKMFAEAKKNAPCILFIDEIDAVGRQRSGANAKTAHEEREQTLNQLLVEMDGFKANSGVIVIAATNRPDILDEALTRPGRFSRHVVLNTPDLAGREKILAVHTAKIKLSPQVNLTTVARGTPGFSGAELMHLTNEAAILAARAGRKEASPKDFEDAKDRILMGTERPTLMGEEDRRLTAYHEAGHAVVTLHCPASDPIHKATIVPRGQALGMVVRLPVKDSPALRRSRLLADLAVAMGGRAAEQLIFGEEEISTGASGDIQMATRIARKMVTEWGMSDKLGMVAFSGQHGDPYTSEGMRSEATSREIDTEIRRLIDEAHERALTILRENAAELEAIAQGLLEHESLNASEIKALKDEALVKYPHAAFSA